jgi:hypothetical protein
VPWLGQRISGPVVVHVLVLATQETVVAVLTLLDIDDQVPSAHFMPLSPFQGSICTRQEFAAILWDFSIIIRLEVSWFTHPPRSTEDPGSPSGS